MKKVAIACQGGGSHAAFAAGVLARLLAPDAPRPFEIVGLSGTSGGRHVRRAHVARPRGKRE